MATDQEIDLKGLLSQLDSDEVRPNVVIKTGGREESPEEFIKRTIDEVYGTGQSGDTDKPIYKKVGMLWSAARVAKKGGLTKMEQKLHTMAIKFYDEVESYCDAYRLFHKAGLTGRAKAYKTKLVSAE